MLKMSMCSSLPAGAFWVCVHVNSEALSTTSGVILEKIMRWGLSLTYSSLIKIEWKARIPQASSWLFLPSVGITHVHHHASHFYMEFCDPTWIFLLTTQKLCQLSYRSALKFFIGKQHYFNIAIFNCKSTSKRQLQILIL